MAKETETRGKRNRHEERETPTECFGGDIVK